jgi:hemerythrin
MEAGDETLGRGVVRTIRKWIVDHINGDDLEYAKVRA